MKLGSLFSGYGGLDLAVSAVFNTTTAWVSDIEAGPCKILAHRYPGVPNIGDITRVDWETVEPVDIIAGGSPCQDVSMAGKRTGMKPGTRSGLWESMREAIAVIKPALVVWENVQGVLNAEANSFSELEQDQGPVGGGADGPINRAMGRVLGDLTGLGYDTQWLTIRASDIGAPHHRARVFLLGHAYAGVADTDSKRTARRDHATGEVPARGPHLPASRPSSGNSGTWLSKVKTLPTPDSYQANRDGSQHPDKHRAGGHSVALADVVEHTLTKEQYLPTVLTSDGNAGGPSDLNMENASLRCLARYETNWGPYQAAITRWENITRPAPNPTIPGPGYPRLSLEFTEWMMGLPQGWITDTPGITRAEAIRACGNGVVPQQAEAALRALLETMNTY